MKNDKEIFADLEKMFQEMDARKAAGIPEPTLEEILFSLKDNPDVPDDDPFKWIANFNVTEPDIIITEEN